MVVLVWLLAIVFLMAGGMKLAQPKEKLAENMAWVEDFSANTVKIIGGLEVLGALGLILPRFLGFLPGFLGQLAAVGLALTMAGAAYTHIRRGETKPAEIAPSIVLLILAIIVALFAPF